jgi:hypothetical protein
MAKFLRGVSGCQAADISHAQVPYDSSARQGLAKSDELLLDLSSV